MRVRTGLLEPCLVVPPYRYVYWRWGGLGGAAGAPPDLRVAAGPSLPAVRQGGGDDDWAPGTAGTVGRSSGGHDTVDIWTVTVRVMWGRVQSATRQVMEGVGGPQSSVQEGGRREEGEEKTWKQSGRNGVQKY